MASDFRVQVDADFILEDCNLIGRQASQEFADFLQLFVVEEICRADNGTRPSPDKSKLMQPTTNCFTVAHYRLPLQQEFGQDLARSASPKVPEILGRRANHSSANPLRPPWLCRGLLINSKCRPESFAEKPPLDNGNQICAAEHQVQYPQARPATNKQKRDVSMPRNPSIRTKSESVASPSAE